MQKALEKYQRIHSRSELAEVAIDWFCHVALTYGLDADFRPLLPSASRDLDADGLSRSVKKGHRRPT